MATNELDTQLDMDHNADIESPTETAYPTEKSGVRNDPNYIEQTGKFGKLDIVHMALIERGERTKGIFKVARSRLNKKGDFIEYQLEDGQGNLFKNGAWIREKDLKLERNSPARR